MKPSIEINLEGWQLEVTYSFTPAQPEYSDCPAEPEVLEIESAISETGADALIFLRDDKITLLHDILREQLDRKAEESLIECGHGRRRAA